MTSPPDNYMLTRGLGPSIRLVAQHFLWRDHYGWNLHPAAGQKWQSDPSPPRRVADVATGNAIWAVDEARSHPQNAYVGFDISAAQFPPRDSWPENVLLQTLDATGAIPAELVGTFDAVHVRLLVGAVRANDPRPLLRNALALLKPGGLLQWGEILPVAVTLGKPNHVSVAGKLINMGLRRIGCPEDVEDNWICRLQESFEEVGLKGVEVVKREPKREMWGYWGENSAGALEEMVVGAKLEGATGWLEEMAAERARGEYVWFEPVIVVGWKAE